MPVAESQPTKTNIDISVSVATVPHDPMPRVLIVMGADTIALKLEDAVRLSGLILDSCDVIRNRAQGAAMKACLQ